MVNIAPSDWPRMTISTNPSDSDSSDKENLDPQDSQSVERVIKAAMKDMTRDPRRVRAIEQEIFHIMTQIAEVSLISKESSVFHDDIFISTAGFNQHIASIRTVFQFIREKGQKLCPSRCRIFWEITNCQGTPSTDMEIPVKALPLFKVRKKRKKKGRYSW